MKLDIHQPPREFSPHPGLTLRDAGDVYLAPEEQVTIRVSPDRGNDVLRKSWGFYLTNSLNGTLRSQGLRTALARNVSSERLYVLLVEEDKLEDFTAYLKQFGMELLRWLDEWPEPAGR
jgi:hypothetical protein